MDKIKVLDHGYVALIESWGSDERIIEAARMSTGRGFEGWEKDFKLLKFLYDNKHATPFEMGGLVIEVKAPIFVFREWHRHRTQSYNEMSARYISLPNENYVPEVQDIVHRSRQATESKNRQAGASRKIDQLEAEGWVRALERLYQQAETLYNLGIEQGVPKELARLPVPVARYSRMRASANLRNWLGFLDLRLASNAQQEIRQYAQAVAQIVALQFPKTWQLFSGDE